MTLHQLECKKSYSDYLVNAVPIWEIENRGWTYEEAQAFRDEVERLGKEPRK